MRGSCLLCNSVISTAPGFDVLKFLAGTVQELTLLLMRFKYFCDWKLFVQTDAKLSIYSRTNFQSSLTFFKHKLIVTSTENLLVLFLKENYLIFIGAMKSEKR